MSTEAIHAITAVASAVQAVPAQQQAPAMSFGQMVASGLQDVNRQLVTGQVEVQKLALSESQSLHEVMVRLEESRISFQLMMQVRNRLLESYQDVMRMQV